MSVTGVETEGKRGSHAIRSAIPDRQGEQAPRLDWRIQLAPADGSSQGEMFEGGAARL